MWTTMEVSVVITCLVVFGQLYCVLCDPPVDRDCQKSITKSHERTKRSHEIDSPSLKEKVKDSKQNKTIPPIGSKQKPKTVPKVDNKEILSVNEKNKPKDVKIINNLLEEIATIARNHNETKGIHKIRNLVNEIDNLNKAKSSVTSNNLKTPKEECVANKNVIKEKVSNKLSEECKIVPIIPNDVKSKSAIEINADKIINRRRLNKEISLLADQPSRKEMKNENLIEIEEHKYEEELLRCPYKYDQKNRQNLCMGQNYYAGYNVAPYAYVGQGNTIENDYTTRNNYPLATYGKYEYGNNGYYYINYPSPTSQPMYHKSSDYMRLTKILPNKNTVLSANLNKQFAKNLKEDNREIIRMRSPNFIENRNYIENYDASGNNYVLATDGKYERENNGYYYLNTPYPTNQQYSQDYTKLRKTWLDKDSIISAKTPNEQIVKNINEDRKELTSIQSPEFCRKYYTLNQKQYSTNNDVLNNQYQYGISPYQCSK